MSSLFVYMSVFDEKGGSRVKQTEKFYLISDAAKQVKVETHVLRYWEEELGLPIKRNELGHRYYTGEDIDRFIEVRDLKEQGLQLKAIKTLLDKGAADMMACTQGICETDSVPDMKRHVVMVNKGQFMPLQEESKEAKSLRLQQLLQNMIVEAVRSNNHEMCEQLKESLLKELDYQFRLQEEREDEREVVRLERQEEHYRQIDELIRARNRRNSRREGVNKPEANVEEKPGEKRMGFLRKKRSII